MKNCYSSDTEYLTDKGWFTHDKIGADTNIAYYEPRSESIKFTYAGEKLSASGLTNQWK